MSCARRRPACETPGDKALPMVRFRRLLKRLLLAASIFFVLAAAGLALLIAWEWTYVDRLLHHPEKSILDVAWYAPQEAVPGGGGERLPRARPEEIPFERGALEEAARLAEGKNAAALLAAH